MKKLMIIVAAIVAAAGCKTRIEAEKNPELVFPIYKPTVVNGTNTTYVADYIRASGGWHATASSPLWAKEELRGLSICVSTNGTVSLVLDDYARDLSTNAVALTKVALDGAAQLAAKIGAAIATSGGSVAAEGGIAALASQAVALFKSRGGDVNAAKISKQADGSLLVSDGSTCVTCKDGTCSPGVCGD